ncbi:MAG: nucleotide sugar dehydrogenase, partial [Actinomycetota bacterium]|nr:nucleotide sugar dehydrogenase [Actinomycetota bacterium]
LGFSAWTGGPVDAAVVQTDHAEYAALSPAHLPGAQVVVDGRGVLDPARWESVTLRRIGTP